MKKLIPFLTPLILSAFIYYTSQSVSHAGSSQTVNVSIQHSVDGKTFNTLFTLPVDLSTAKTNSAGQLYIVVDPDNLPMGYQYEQAVDNVIIAGNGSVAPVGLFRGATGTTPVNVEYVPNGVTPTPNVVVPLCAGIIIGLIIIVVMGIIIYYLVKTCKKCLNPPPRTNSEPISLVSPFPLPMFASN